jgi:thiamine-phosphate pyrophosphorylase
LLYLITDRLKLLPTANKSAFDALAEFVEQASRAGVDLVQLRERDLQGRDLFALTGRIAEIARGRNTRVLVNDRADIAAACPGVGVHLTTRSLRVEVVRKTFGDDLLIGASTHSIAEARAAEEGGANFIVFGPVFETASKKLYGAPVGLQALREVANRVQIPVLALGGVKLSNFKEALAAGATGVAAISLFTDAGDLSSLARALKEE